MSNSASSTTGTGSGNTVTGLSTGAIAGIAVAAVLVGLAIIAWILFFIWRKRRHAAAAAGIAEAPYYNEVGNEHTGVGAGGYYGENTHKSDMMDPSKDAANGYGSPGMESPGFPSPGMMHEVHEEGVPAQLYGSETTRQAHELA